QRLSREAQNRTRAAETLRARVRALESSLQSGEGASPAVRALLQAVRKGELQGEYLPVGAALAVPEAYQLAVNAALGNAVNDIITPTEADARAAVQWLQRNRAGRLTFLPLDLLQPRLPRKPAEHADGVVGVAADLVQYDPRYEPAVRHLLGRVLIVETLEQATQLVRTLRRQARGGDFSRIATLDGAVVQLSGAITGGAHANERSTLLQLKAELDRARAELHDAETQRTRAENALETHRAAHYERQHALETLRRRLRETAQARLRLEAELKQRAREAEHHTSLFQRAQTQLEQLERLLSAPSHADLPALEAERERLQREFESHTRQLAQQRAALQHMETRRRELVRQLESEQRDLIQLQQRRHSRAERLHTLHQETAQLQAERARAQAELQRIREQVERVQAELDARRAERQTLLEQSFALNDRIRALRSALSERAERERQLDLQIARGEVRLAELQEHWARLMPHEPLPDSDEPLPDKSPVARAELERLRRALADMGEVNPAAADEYARLSERFQHLERQRADLEQTCAHLQQQLREIDAHAREQFLKTFEAVQGAFQMRFQQLFEGGQVALTLTDGRDPLAAGVVVEAQPPGKRRQRLELLSGGERALTAIALLFAFSTVKPSPLMILDEVDAALDGRNVQRFADYLKLMANDSQILIVTHNPITTAVARQWLGVSMTGGVSRIVPYTPPESLMAPETVERRRAIIQPVSETTPQP
ncbi:MAG: AAA family ATPase, partial [Fimbriimonadales bacterium]